MALMEIRHMCITKMARLTLYVRQEAIRDVLGVNSILDVVVKDVLNNNAEVFAAALAFAEQLEVL
jgi:hypothetical protein